MIYGNKEGIRDSLLAKLETLYDIEIPAEVFAPAELLDGAGGIHMRHQPRNQHICFAQRRSA